MDELMGILMSWAVLLSGYTAPAQSPQLVRVPASYLSAAACHGRPCKVMGWFPPGQQIYLDERLDPRASVYASSVLVHEMVHYLQQESGKFGTPHSCESTIAMEREAYAAQREFLLRYGVYQPVGASMHHVGCELAAQEPVSLHH